MLKDDNFFGDTNDTPKKHPKKVIISVSVFNLASAIIKWVQEMVDKASNKAINETHAAYKTA